MLINKIAKNVCYIFLIIMLLLSVISTASSIIGIINGSSICWFLLVFSLLMPFAVIMPTAQFLSIMNMDKNIEFLNKQIDSLKTDIINQNRITNPPSNYPEAETTTANILENDVFCFINERYGINLGVTDDINEIKNKISTIQTNNPSALIFKERVLSTTNINEIQGILKMHRAVNLK